MFATGEAIVCGTSTTGTGTLTLAACPSAIGGCDPVAALGTSGAWPCNPVIIEYTDSTFATISKMEVGKNCTLTLAAAITSATLTRSPDVTFVSGTYTNNGATAITIGTAANVLVYFGPTAFDTVSMLPAYSTSGITSADGLGVAPLQVFQNNGSANFSLANNTAYFAVTLLMSSGFIKSLSIRTNAALTTPTSNSVAAALFEIDSTGLPGKRIIDFGTVSGTSGAPLGATGSNTLTASAGAYVRAGFYITGLLPVWSGGSGTPRFTGCTPCAPSPFGTIYGSTGGGPAGVCIVTSSPDMADPPNLTGITALNTNVMPALAFRST